MDKNGFFANMQNYKSKRVLKRDPCNKFCFGFLETEKHSKKRGFGLPLPVGKAGLAPGYMPGEYAGAAAA